MSICHKCNKLRFKRTTARVPADSKLRQHILGELGLLLITELRAQCFVTGTSYKDTSIHGAVSEPRYDGFGLAAVSGGTSVDVDCPVNRHRQHRYTALASHRSPLCPSAVTCTMSMSVHRYRVYVRVIVHVLSSSAVIRR